MSGSCFATIFSAGLEFGQLFRTYIAVFGSMWKEMPNQHTMVFIICWKQLMGNILKEERTISAVPKGIFGNA